MEALFLFNFGFYFSKPQHKMVTALIILSLIAFGLIIIVYTASKEYTDLHGLQSMLKVPRSYKIRYDIFSCVFALFFIIMGFIMLSTILKLKNQGFIPIILIIILGSLFITLGALIYSLEIQVFKINGKRTYTFNPLEKKVSVSGVENTSFYLTDIQEIIRFQPNNYKFALPYYKIILKDQRIIILTSRIPCYDNFDDFFKNIPITIVHKVIGKIE